MKRRRNPNLIIAVVVLVSVGMIIGYAYLSKTLNINGTIGVTKNTWNVKFRNIQVENGSVSATSGPELNGDNTTITITPTLNNLGDYYEFTVEVYNDGSIDAMLQAVPANPLSTEQQKLLEWSLTYDDGIELTANDILRTKESDTLRVRVAYKTNITSENDLNSAGTSSISFTITYVQVDSTSRDRGMNGARMLIKKANAADRNYSGENAVSDEQKKEMFAFEHTSPVAKTDYRYIGSAPNNYITFNEEEWRIIGVFDKRIKIIKDTRIGDTETIRWDYKQGSTLQMLGSSQHVNGSNDWTDSQLMYMLNSDDYKLKVGYSLSGNLIKDANGSVIYQIGKRPAQQDNRLLIYSGTTDAGWSLNDTTKSQIADTAWYLGALTYDVTNKTWGTTEEMYQAERGNVTCYNSTTISESNRCLVERPIRWTGKVGLIYPSDYGYTFGKGVHDGCYGNTGQCYSSGVVSGADPKESWLHESEYHQWTVSPNAVDSHEVMLVSSPGYVTSNDAYRFTGVRPCVYLKSNIRLIGSGTSGDPYQIVEE